MFVDNGMIFIYYSEMTSRKIMILFNPSSGKGRSLKQKEKIETLLKAHGIDYDLIVTESEDHLRQSAAEAAGHYETIVGVGGDTTFNIIAGKVLEYGKNAPAIGMIGTGSANDIVRGLGIEKIEDACRIIKNGEIRKMDVGRLKINTPPQPETFIFMGTLSLGLGTTVNRYIEDFHQRHGILSKLKPFDQLFSGLYAIHDSFSKKKVPLTVEMAYRDLKSGETIVKPLEFSLLVFLNTPYYANGMRLGEENGLFDGVLDCRVIHTRSFLGTLRTGLRIREGKTNSEGVGIMAIRSVWFNVSSKEAIDIQVDGEIIEGVKEFEILIIPGALTVLGED